jgi:hypothetical protein
MHELQNTVYIVIQLTRGEAIRSVESGCRACRLARMVGRQVSSDQVAWRTAASMRRCPLQACNGPKLHGLPLEKKREN